VSRWRCGGCGDRQVSSRHSHQTTELPGETNTTSSSHLPHHHHHHHHASAGELQDEMLIVPLQRVSVRAALGTRGPGTDSPEGGTESTASQRGGARGTRCRQDATRRQVGSGKTMVTMMMTSQVR